MLSFQYNNITIPINLSDATVNSIRSATETMKRSHRQDFDKIDAIIQKVTPVALAVIATLALMPIWAPSCALLSFFIGSFSYPVAAIAAAKGYEVIKDICQKFFQQCPEIKNYAVCNIVLLSKLSTIITTQQNSSF